MDAALKQGGAMHGTVFLVSLGAVAVLFSPLSWPWYLLLPLLVYAVVVLAWPRMRRTAPRLGFGRLEGWPLATAVLVSVATVVVLVVFQALACPELTDLAAGVPMAAFGNLLVAGVCFSVANATLEELIFRGILWEVAAAEWSGGVALGATSALFGLGHLHGYPPGPLGVVLASLFGLALGVLRWWCWRASLDWRWGCFDGGLEDWVWQLQFTCAPTPRFSDCSLGRARSVRQLGDAPASGEESDGP